MFESQQNAHSYPTIILNAAKIVFPAIFCDLDFDMRLWFATPIAVERAIGLDFKNSKNVGDLRLNCPHL
ncbi:hypothetical protein P0M11_08900 [Kaistella sp. PBT33-4]|uniref:hypothetical protein n=1 Tax=Kaistella sp. PBT33-4 TaxID=3032000 RepID=UPI0023D81ED9|nr:hypothetical protein [Kaistella sp. PBT33-4]MDF0720116.1 hypothetical protein [Kaistella sp. PBT33-4]